MGKSDIQKVKEIDDEVKAELRALDNTKANIFEKDFCLVMDNSDIVKHGVVDAPLRSSEHRVLLCKKGSIDYTLNFSEVHVSEGNLLMVPANYLITPEGYSSDFNARVLSFRFSNREEASLVGYEVVKLRLGCNEEQVFDTFFQMMDQVLRSPTDGRRDFEYLVISMLYRIQGLNTAQNGFSPTVFGDRKQEVFSQFMQLISSLEPTPRSISVFAEKLNVTSNYLSVLVKEVSKRTVMDWVDIRTVARIKALLIGPDNLTVEQIADRLHFSSSSQMIRVFKKMTGTTPLEYKKSRKDAMPRKKGTS
ncbi:MAG: AraC family transcriptional regulator [Bacteroidales bacterium]|nr:AraC family transcriptional regulator [Bacteroidales bacterium]